MTTGLAKDFLESCGSYDKERDELVCLESTLDNTSLLVQGMNEEARRNYMKSTRPLKQRRDELREDIGRPSKTHEDIGEVTVADKVVK